MNQMSTGKVLGLVLFISLAALLLMHRFFPSAEPSKVPPPAAIVVQSEVPAAVAPVQVAPAFTPSEQAPKVNTPQLSVPASYKAAYDAEAAAFAKARASAVRAQCLRDAADSKIAGDVRSGHITDANIFTVCK